MNAPPTPANPAQLVEAVRAWPRVIAVGAGTKPRLSAASAVKISMTSLRGIVEYEPSEFTFTALAGTPVREIAAALAERGQYLPFDPMFLDAGATLGGTVAGGISGPGRFRFGGVRDFILGVRFVDGAGRLLRLGAKVVKNAAGFDLPKFFVGSLGRFGILVEVTFKVFPYPVASLTLKLEAGTPEAAVQIMTAAAGSRWEPHALDWLPDEPSLALRLAGPAAALPPLAQQILDRWPGQILAPIEADAVWRRLRECSWTPPDAPLVKVAVSPLAAVALAHAVKALPGAQIHLSAGGDVAFISPASGQCGSLDDLLREQKFAGMMLRGEGPLWLGKIDRPAIALAVKNALDAEGRFPSLDD